jgi:hypothetical protein
MYWLEVLYYDPISPLKPEGSGYHHIVQQRETRQARVQAHAHPRDEIPSHRAGEVEVKVLVVGLNRSSAGSLRNDVTRKGLAGILG